jgi:hypothetical protein
MIPPWSRSRREGSISTETRRAALTALAGLAALALPGAIASSDVADAALVDLGALAQCDAQETLCPMTTWSRANRSGLSPRTNASPATGATGRLSGPPFRLSRPSRRFLKSELDPSKCSL